MQQQNIQAQSQANTAAAQEAAKIEMEKNQAKSDQDMNLEKTRNALKIDYLNNESRVKKELMLLEFNLSSKLAREERANSNQLESIREDRKDKRIDIDSQNKLKLQREKDANNAKTFESSGNDILGAGVSLDRFDPL